MTRTQKYDPKLLTEQYLNKHPEASNGDLYAITHATTNSQKGYIRKLKSRLLDRINNEESPESNKQKISEKSENNHSQNSSKDLDDIQHILESIENPVSFASAHIFKKMVETGDVRWAQLYVSLLDKTNKLDYDTLKEEQWLDQAKNMRLQDIVSLVAKRESISRSTSRRLDELDDTSPLDSFSDA